MGSREQLIERSIPFLREVKDMTPGAAMERWLNETYGEESALYQDLGLDLMGADLGSHQVFQCLTWAGLTGPDPNLPILAVRRPPSGRGQPGLPYPRLSGAGSIG